MNRQLRHRLLTEYPEWHNNPLLLSKKEMEHPNRVLDEFFDCYHLKGFRACLREWLHEAMRPNEILEMDFLQLHDHILKLTEAAWLLHNSKTCRSKKKKKK